MLNAKELKVVVATLSKRRAWLRKSLEDNSIEKDIRDENVEALRLLDSAIQKLASTNQPSKPKPQIEKPKKAVKLAEARILVAEDNEDSATLLEGILKDMGILQVDLATDGMEAFDKIKRAIEAPYHIILCDWDMPELDGLEVHSKAKASNTLMDAHFVMVTAVTDKPRIKQAVQQGISDYIVKPVDPDILETKIKVALNLESENNSS